MDDLGFTLLETLAALAILTVAALATAQLLSAAAIAVHDSRVQTIAATLASQRVEQLLAMDWEAPALAPSPAGTLEADIAGYVDFLDGDGARIGNGSANAVFVRRWALDVPAGGNADARVIRVVVRSLAADAAGARGAHGEARLVTVRSRLAR